MAVGRLFLCLFLIVKVTDDICRKNISTYAACNSNKEIDNVGHDSTSSLSEDIYVNWTLLFRCDSITAYYPSHIAKMKRWCLSARLYYLTKEGLVNHKRTNVRTNEIVLEFSSRTTKTSP